MRLPFFRAKEPADEPPKPGRPARKVAAARTLVAEGPDEPRTRARRRLIGALVLLVVGVVGFPMLFETQPRPLPLDTPILLPQGASPRVAAAPALPSLKPLPALPPDAGNETPAAPAAVAEPGSSKGPAATLPAAPPAPASSPAAAVPAAVKPEPIKPEPVKAEPASPEAVSAGGGRFVVQVGAFTDTERLRAARQKLEKLGIKTYTQEIQTATGKSTRVRVGPYASRQEADAVASKVKASGMQANILAL